MADGAPIRIQLRRTRGWRLPAGAQSVARPTRWGNPFPLTGDWIMWTAVALGHNGGAAGRRDAALALHRAWLLNEPVRLGGLAASTEGGHLEFTDGSVVSLTDHVLGIASLAARISEPPMVPASPLADIHGLAGHDLACWCPLDKPCHADVLLELANR